MVDGRTISVRRKLLLTTLQPLGPVEDRNVSFESHTLGTSFFGSQPRSKSPFCVLNGLKSSLRRNTRQEPSEGRGRVHRRHQSDGPRLRDPFQESHKCTKIEHRKECIHTQKRIISKPVLIDKNLHVNNSFMICKEVVRVT